MNAAISTLIKAGSVLILTMLCALSCALLGNAKMIEFGEMRLSKCGLFKCCRPLRRSCFYVVIGAISLALSACDFRISEFDNPYRIYYEVTMDLSVEGERFDFSGVFQCKYDSDAVLGFYLYGSWHAPRYKLVRYRQMAKRLPSGAGLIAVPENLCKMPRGVLAADESYVQKEIEKKINLENPPELYWLDNHENPSVIEAFTWPIYYQHQEARIELHDVSVEVSYKGRVKDPRREVAWIESRRQRNKRIKSVGQDGWRGASAYTAHISEIGLPEIVIKSLRGLGENNVIERRGPLYNAVRPHVKCPKVVQDNERDIVPLCLRRAGNHVLPKQLGDRFDLESDPGAIRGFVVFHKDLGWKTVYPKISIDGRLLNEVRPGAEPAPATYLLLFDPVKERLVEFGYISTPRVRWLEPDKL